MIGSRQNLIHLSRAFTFFSYSMPQRSKLQFDGQEWEAVTKSEMLRGSLGTLARSVNGTTVLLASQRQFIEVTIPR